MSMFRKTALTSAIIGAGLVSTAGAAFAGDAPHEGHHGSHHHSSSSTTSNTCVNEAGGSVDNGGATLVGGVTGSQGALGLNVLCDVLNGSLNGNGSNNTYDFGTPEASAPEQEAAPAETASTQQVQQAAPAPQAAPASAGQDVTTQKIQ